MTEEGQGRYKNDPNPLPQIREPLSLNLPFWLRLKLGCGTLHEPAPFLDFLSFFILHPHSLTRPLAFRGS